MGILKAGAAYLPLDPTYPKERLAFMVSDAQVSVLLTQHQWLATLPNHQAQVICLDADWERIAQHHQHNPVTQVTADHLAYILYTSGSTGQPKGVLIPHRALVNFLSSMRLSPGLTDRDILLSVTTLSFDIAALELFLPIMVGARVVLVSREVAADGTQLLEHLNRSGATVMQATPATWRLLLTAGWQGNPHLKILCGGEALPRELANELRVRCASLWNLYGPTETTIWSTLHPIDEREGSVPIGHPIANTQVYVLDHYLQPVPVGVPGELYIGGEGLAVGYFNRPDLTAEKFIPHPFEPDKRLYKTGDLVKYLPDGNLEFLSRIDHQVKLRGFRIELAEIESVLRQHPAVQEVVVTAPREDDASVKRLVAYVVSSPEQKPEISELRRLCSEKLPGYMIPSAFVLLDTLPLTPNGKIDRRALKAPELTQSEAVYVAPRTPIEKQLAKIWTQILNVKPIGIHDNFFDLGGHSLLLTQLVTQVRSTFQINLSLRTLFEIPTLAGLAETIESLQQTHSRTPMGTQTFVDLRAEAVLDPAICPDATSPLSSSVNAILLTGATGFLGAFLLDELLQQTQADIYCLVRASNLESAKNKLQSCLKSYLLWDESLNHRIIPVVGDLSQPGLGLCEEDFRAIASQIDVIYHNGAWVHHAYPYSTLKATNVLGTQEVLRLASQIKVKPVHFISTTSVFSADGDSGVKVVREQDSLDDWSIPSNGYAQSKWVAEMLVMLARDRALPISIYRLGRISGHSQTGMFNVNDFLYRLIIGCIQLGGAPAGEIMLDIMPVDYVSKAIVSLSRQSQSLGKAFHLVNPYPLSSNHLIETIRSIGYPLQQITEKEWQDKLLHLGEDSPEHSLYPLIPFFLEKDSQNPTADLQFDSQETLEELENLSIFCPKVDEAVLHTYFSHLIKDGFLEAPPQHEICC